MNRWTAAGFLLAMLVATGGCDALGMLSGEVETEPVFIIDVDGLSPPAVAEARLYRPEVRTDLNTALPADRPAVLFHLIVNTTKPASLRLRLFSGQSRTPAELTRLPPPDANAGTPPSAPVVPADAAASLNGGSGVFWLEGSDGPELDIGVALPDAVIAPTATLEVFTSAAADGSPIGSDRIELARDFFYLAVIGDSVAWGNGLREREKFSTLVANEIQRRTGRRVVREVHALSGARVAPHPEDILCQLRCGGEVPRAMTSAIRQVDLLQAPEVLDLALVTACINDVGVVNILAPEQEESAIAAVAEQACRTDVAVLLRDLRAKAPRAAIVVTGYYPIISEETTLPELLQLLVSQQKSLDAPAVDLVQQAARRAEVFLQTAHAGLAAAVEAVRADTAGSLAFVDVGFNSHNALFATEPLLWGLTASRIQPRASEEGLTLFPEDPLADLRATVCFDGSVLVDPISCLYASVGHPNVEGARRYAARILATLESLGVLPP